MCIRDSGKTGFVERKLVFQPLRPLNHPQTEHLAYVKKPVVIAKLFAYLFGVGFRISRYNAVDQCRACLLYTSSEPKTALWG